MSLGSAASQHRAAADHYLVAARGDIQQMERNPRSCLHTFFSIVGAERAMAKAATHETAKGSPIREPRRYSKRERHQGGALKSLRDRLNDLTEKFENECLKG